MDLLIYGKITADFLFDTNEIKTKLIRRFMLTTEKIFCKVYDYCRGHRQEIGIAEAYLPTNSLL